MKKFYKNVNVESIGVQTQQYEFDNFFQEEIRLRDKLIKLKNEQINKIDAKIDEQKKMLADFTAKNTLLLSKNTGLLIQK